MKQLYKVKVNTSLAGPGEPEWFAHYTLYEDMDNFGRIFFALYEGPDEVCRGFNRTRMVNLTFRLGEIVERTEPLRLVE